MDAYQYEGKRYLVLSEMVELGSESEKAHQEVLNAIQDIQVDGVYTLGNEFKKFENDYSIEAFLDREEFNQRARELFKEEALILIKGSRSYALENLLGKE